MWFYFIFFSNFLQDLPIDTAYKTNHAENIEVQFVVLHYTAAGLNSSLRTLTNVNRHASAHLLIAENGQIYELVNCLNGQAKKAGHAGKSKWFSDGHVWENFNNFAIGIEMVNLNGNLNAFTADQYKALQHIIKVLKEKYPALRNPNRVIGHEHIAGFRGKADPGIVFNWKKFFKENYTDHPAPHRPALITENSLKNLISKKDYLIKNPTEISAWLEENTAAYYKNWQDSSAYAWSNWVLHLNP